MRGEQYRNMTAYMSETKKRSTIVKTLHDILPALMYVFYPIQLVYLGVTAGFLSETFLRFTLIPLGTFIFVTLLRAIINAKRPYEVYDYEPVVHKATKGKSFPSRHTVSAFIIAMAFMYLDIRLGIAMMVVATMIAIVRVVAGVHFVRDVIGGAVIGIVVGVLGFFVF